MAMTFKILAVTAFALSAMFYFMVGKGLQRQGYGWADDVLPTALLAIGVACLVLAWQWARMWAWRAERAERKRIEREILNEEIDRRMNAK